LGNVRLLGLLIACAGCVCGYQASLGIVGAHADAFGELAKTGGFGTGAGKFTFPIDLAVDTSNNSVFVLDEPEGEQPGAGPKSFRIQKFGASLGAPEATVTVPTPSVGAEEDLVTIDGMAVDSSLHRLYVLKSVQTSFSGAWTFMASEIEAYSDEGSMASLGVYYSFPAVPAQESEITADMIGRPDGLAVDPNHDLVVIGLDGTSNTRVARITAPGPTFSAGTLEGVYDDGTSGKVSTSYATGVAVGPDGAIYLSSTGAPGPGVFPGVVKIAPGSLTNPAISVVHKEQGNEKPELTGGNGAGGRHDNGPQVAVSPDGSLVYMAEVTAGQGEEPATEPKQAGSYEIRGMSTTDGKEEVVFGGAATSSSHCLITSQATAMAAGSGGVVYALDEGDTEATPDHTTFGFNLIKFGPNGSGCPTPVASFKIDSDVTSETVEVQKGQEVKLEASAAELHNEEPTKLLWEVEGPEKFNLESTGTPASLKAAHKILKGGSYTVTLNMTVSPGSFGAPPPVSRKLKVVVPPPTASIEASDQNPKSGEKVTFNGAGSIDPTGSEQGTPTHELQAYIWNFGDGSAPVTTTAREVSHVFTNSGSGAVSDTVSLTVVSKENVASTTPATLALSVQGTPSSGGGGGGTTTTTTGSAPPPPPPPVDRSPTNVSPRVVAGQGMVKLTVACPISKISCAGTVALKATPKAKSSKHKGAKVRPVTLGGGTFALVSGKSETLTVHLSAAGLALLKREKTVKAEIVVAAHDSFGDPKTITLTVTLHAPKKHK
jgi:hypothetical protein